MAPSNSKTSILNHMNEHHQDSLSLYLRVYNKVPASEAKHAHLEDATPNDLIITTKDPTTRYSVPFDPPLESTDAIHLRPRIISMHKACLSSLGLSDIVVREYRPPSGFLALVFGLCLSTFITTFRRGNFLPGSLLYEALHLGSVPGFANLCYTYQPVFFPIFASIHLSEAVLLAFKRLRPYRVPFLSRLWVLWFTSNVIEGFGAWVRFDSIVKEEKERVKGE